MKEDVMRIMKMVEEGKINAEKGSELIEALNGNKLSEKFVVNNSNEGMMLKIKVKSSTNDNVNIKLPINFIKGVLASCGKLPMNVKGMEGIDIDMLVQAIDSGLTGRIVDVQTGDGDIVEVVIE